MNRPIKIILTFIALALLLPACASSPTKAAPTPTSSAAIQPVDANKDGVIDETDVLILLGQADQYWDQNLEPLMAKAGLDTSDPGTLPDLSKLQKLSTDEVDQLLQAVDGYNQLEQQILATAKAARKTK